AKAEALGEQHPSGSRDGKQACRSSRYRAGRDVDADGRANGGGRQGARRVRRLSGAPVVATPNTLGRLTGPPPGPQVLKSWSPSNTAGKYFCPRNNSVDGFPLPLGHSRIEVQAWLGCDQCLLLREADIRL